MDLNHARLPIPPFLHFALTYNIILYPFNIVKYFLGFYLVKNFFNFLKKTFDNVLYIWYYITRGQQVLHNIINAEVLELADRPD